LYDSEPAEWLGQAIELDGAALDADFVAGNFGSIEGKSHSGDGRGLEKTAPSQCFFVLLDRDCHLLMITA
jgi:hypothetical protein